MMNYDTYKKNLNAHELKHAPEKLFYKGQFDLLSNPKLRVSVVGSRKPSKQGIVNAMNLSKFLVQNEITVVSGLAEGIDTLAHKTAISCGGSTIAVVGTSLNKTYPKSNLELGELIKKDHLMISQFEYDTFNKGNFPRRNRTMALISDATIIVEASERSGTISQGWECIRLNRDLFIFQDVVDKGYEWTKDMIAYGAQVIDESTLNLVIEELLGYYSWAE